MVDEGSSSTFPNICQAVIINGDWKVVCIYVVSFVCPVFCIFALLIFTTDRDPATGLRW